MSRYKSEQTAYNPLKKKNVPIWRLDTNTLTVTHFNPETHTEEHKTYYSDYVKYHLHYSDSHCPDRLRRLINEGRIIEYLDAVKSGDEQKRIGLENCFVYMAREAVFECMVYI
jgi:hypothetical protein